MTRAELAMLNALRRGRAIALHRDTKGRLSVRIGWLKRWQTIRPATEALLTLVSKNLAVIGPSRTLSHGHEHKVEITTAGLTFIAARMAMRRAA